MENPLITMSAITGKPTKKRIFEYLKGLKNNGIEQAMIYPRSGCEIEYLSKKWFKTVGSFIDCASRLNMKLWLYDDFNWPSGDASGRVTLVEEFRLKAIKAKGENIGTITSKSRHNSGLFGEKYFPNLLSFDAVDYFISCTHEEYYKRFGKHFGKTVKGIFTDEPSIGYCCEGDYIPYYAGIEKDYEKLCDSDFYADMYAGKDSFYHNVIEVVSERFNKCYVSKIASWCKEHGLIMTGHLMCDNDPFGATKHGGRFLKNLSTFGMPGIDEIESNFANQSELTLFGACEYARGENGAMAELFALGPCDISYAKRKCMLYLASAFKIDHYFLAISHFDMRGNLLVKDYFNNFNTDQPDFEGMRLLVKEAEKAASFASKDFKPDVYIRYPFKQCIDGIFNNTYSDKLHSLTRELAFKGIQWKFIDDEVITDAPVIEMNSLWELTSNGEKFDISAIKGSVTIRTLDGKDTNGIFVRAFNDGSMLILNLFADEGAYLINGKSVYLREYSVITELNEKTLSKEEISNQFSVKYFNQNIARQEYINKETNAEIHGKSDTPVRFCVRKGEEAYLNGKKIKCNKKATVLSCGMRDLYKMSEKILLKSGVNTVKSQNDLKYMPTVFVCGDFSCHTESGSICKVHFDKRPTVYKKGEKLYDFGKIELSTKVVVPQGARKIMLEGTDLYTKVYANGERLGASISAPYEFNVDSKFWNEEILLSIEQYSSIAPIFGDTEYWDSEVENVGWRGTPSTKNHSFGFTKAFWLL